MAHDDLNVLSAFLAVAEERSFTKAAKQLNVSQSALSHAVRGLEEEIGVRLLARTTRSVAPTDAGEELLRSLRPALTDIRAALGKISGQRDKPAGRVRLVVSPLAAGSVLGPKLGAFSDNIVAPDARPRNNLVYWPPNPRDRTLRYPICDS